MKLLLAECVVLRWTIASSGGDVAGGDGRVLIIGHHGLSHWCDTSHGKCASEGMASWHACMMNVNAAGSRPRKCWVVWRSNMGAASRI